MADADGTTTGREHIPPVRAECESLHLALEVAADRLAAVIEVLQQTEADIDRAAAWLGALVALDLKRPADMEGRG